MRRIPVDIVRGVSIISIVVLLTACTLTPAVPPPLSPLATPSAEPRQSDITAPEVSSMPSVAPHYGNASEGEGSPIPVAHPSQEPLSAQTAFAPALEGMSLPPTSTPISKETLIQVKLLGWWGGKCTTKLVWSPDGRFLVGGSERTLCVYDTTTFTVTRMFDAPTDVNIYDFAISRDALVIGFGDGTVQFWHLTDTIPFRTIHAHRGSVTGLTVTSDGTTLVTVGTDQKLRLWQGDMQIATGEWPFTVKIIEAVTFNQTHVVLTPDGRTLLAASDEGDVWMWQINEQRSPQRLEHDDTPARSLVVTGDGKMVAASDTFNIWIWRLDTGDLLQHRSTKTFVSASLIFLPDNQTLVFDDDVGYLHLWNVINDHEQFTALIDREIVDSFAFSPTTSMIAMATYKGIVIVDPMRGTRIAALPEIPIWNRQFEIAPDNETLMVSDSRTVYLMRMHDGYLIYHLDPFETPTVNDVSSYLSPDGQHIIAVLPKHDRGFAVIQRNSSDGTIVRRLDVKPHNPLQEGEELPESQPTVIFSPDRRLLAVCYDIYNQGTQQHHNHLDLWQIDDGEYRYSLDDVGCPTFTANGQVFMARGVGDQVEFRRVNDGVRVTSLDVPDVRIATITADGQLLAVKTEQQVQLWDVRHNQLLYTVDGQEVRALSFSPDGTLLCISAADVQIWSVMQGQLLSTLHIDQHPASAVMFSHDSHLLMAFYDDDSLRIWGIPSVAQTTWMRGYARAQAGDVAGAITDFQQVVTQDINLRLDPTTTAHRVATLSFLDEGIAQARQGNIDGAVMLFQKARTRDPDVDLFAAAQSLVTGGVFLARQSQFTQALGALKQARAFVPDIPISVTAWNNVCGAGVLQGVGDAMVGACEQAVQADPHNAPAHIGLGIARVLTGKYTLAATDFQSFQPLLEERGHNTVEVQKYLQLIIAALTSGHNPFSTEELQIWQHEVGHRLTVTPLESELEAPTYGTMGVTVYNLVEYPGIQEAVHRQYGAYIKAVQTNGPSDRNDIRTGDLIIKVGELSIDKDHSLQQILRAYRPGETVEITLLRDAQERQRRVVLGIAPPG